jgi:hypothetical protein
MTMSNDALDRVMSGRSWEEFCDRLKAAGSEILHPGAAATPLDRAEGWRYLSRLTRVALEMMLEHSDPDFPVFYAASHTTVKIGADNPDNAYLNCTVRGDAEYRIRGTRGTAPYLSFGTKANRYAIDGTMASTGEIEDGHLQCAPDGSFEIHVSQQRRSGNWLPMAPDTTLLLVRESFTDRSRQVPAKMTIERLGGPKYPEPLSPEKLDRGLGAAAAFVGATAKTFNDWSRLFKDKAPNRLETLDQSLYQKAGGAPDIHYLHGYWELRPDQALVLDSPVPDCTFWNFQLDNWWMESLDYRYLPVWVNKQSANYNPDGSITLVIAREDVGVGSWIDTAGHTSGTMLLRWVGAREFPVPTARVVALDSLSKR